MSLIQEFKNQTRQLQDFIIDKVVKNEASGDLKSNDIRLINEALSSLFVLIRNINLVPHDKVILQKTYRLGLDVVYQKLFYFSNYHYSYNKITKGDIYKQQEALFQVNVDTSTMLSVIYGLNMGIGSIGGSTDDYYVSRMNRVLWSADYIYNKNNTDLFLPTLYVIYNLSQSLSEYLLCNDNQYQKNAEKLLSENIKLQTKFHNNSFVHQLLQENIPLQLFYRYQLKKFQDALNIDPISEKIIIGDISENRTESKLRILTSLYYLDQEQFTEVFNDQKESILLDLDHQKTDIKNFLFVKCCSQNQFMVNPNEVIEFELNPLKKEQVNFSEQIDSYFNRYSASAGVNLDPGDLEILLSYNDSVLREKVSNSIINVDKHILNRESKKPHGPFEISDMEIPIEIRGKKYFICMPFKSGIEITEKTVPENVAYQIFRPFIHFDNAIVVFITAKRCSQYLMNYIKRMQNKLGWNISVIENEELAKLLKINDQLN